MKVRVALLCIYLVCFTCAMQTAEPRQEQNLDKVIEMLASNQEAMDVFLANLSARDLVHWSKASKFYRTLFKEELLRRRNLVAWASKDLKKESIKCEGCRYQAVVFSSDGLKIAWCGNTPHGLFVQICDVPSLKVERTFEVPGMVENLCFSPDNKILAVSNGLDRVLLVDVNTGTQLLTVAGWRMIFLHDGTLLTLSNEGNLFKWDIKTGKRIGSVALVQGDLIKKLYMKVVFSPDGKKIVGGSDHNLIVWSCETGSRTKELPSEPISALFFSPNGKVLAYKNAFFIKVLDFNTGNILKTFYGDFLSMAFFPDNRVFVTAKRLKSGKISIQLWHVRSGQIINDLSDENLVGNVVLSVSSEGKILAAGSGSHIIFWYRDKH